MSTPMNPETPDWGAASSGEAELERRAFERGRRLADRAGEAVDAAKRRVAGAYERTSREAERAYQGTVDYAREHPGTTALITLGAGIGIGFILAAAGQRAAIRRRMAPAFAVAAAHSIRNLFGRRYR